MNRILLAAAASAALTVPGGCIDNRNPLGTLDSAGSGGTVLVVGGRGGGGETGGSGNAPGSSGGTVGAGPPLIAECTLRGEKLALPRTCIDATDCVAVAQSGTVLLSDAAHGECDLLYFGISTEAEAAFEAFKVGCALVAQCQPTELTVFTQDGQSAPYLGSMPLAACENEVCRSYLP